ncbi:hypothetical protein H072_9094 [Dactylellina haptotyla CBS 200.50]|uniref:Ecp2 effector protein domain-containing protein n=1 Tax=Dactylellina haptotyla (strain CBS 200.50) TaxID=1284197 RepID=S8BPR7_DACHA|nr:hypothetical protein H072_9094 [Dactylellina haptotyla CBS 200.50]
MLFTKPLILVFSSLAALSSAAALPAEQETAVEKREDGPIQKRGDGPSAFCRYYTHYEHFSNYWHFRFDTWGQWDDDWGHGFLDNLRGKCGRNIEDWGFWYDAGQAPTWGHADFKIHDNLFDIGYLNPQCTLDAVWQASSPWGAINGAYCTQVDSDF